MRGNGSDEGTVGQAAGADLNGFEQAWKRAAGADGFDKWAFAEDDRIASGEIGSNDGKRNLHVLELFGVKHTLDDVAETVIAGEAEAGDAPARDIAKTNGAADRKDAGQRRAAGIGSTEDATNAGASDV